MIKILFEEKRFTTLCLGEMEAWGGDWGVGGATGERRD